MPETRYAARPDGVNIAYQVVGDGPMDIVYAPGFVSHLDLQWTDPGFTRFLERLGSFARLIMFDKPGTGVSDPVSSLPTLEERVQDIRIVMDAAGSEQATIMGFSESGATCVLFAASAPERVRSLILYGSFPCAEMPDERPAEMSEDEFAAWGQQAGVVGARIYDLVDHWGEGHVVDLFAPSAANRLQRRFWATFERASASPRMARALLEASQDVDVVEFLPLVSVPTLILHRTGDFIPVQASRFMAARIPGAQLVELPGIDHAFWFGDFDKIVDEIEAFVTGARAPAKIERSLATVLFSDIVQSTARAAELGDRRWRDLLERHDAVVREQVDLFGGRVVKSLGDGTLAVFDGPARAIRCAEGIRSELRGVGISARFGIHSGECELIGDDVGGIAVHIAARVMSHAQDDEILVSSTVADLVVGSDLHFEERGTHELKGVPGQWRLLAAGPDRRARPRTELLPSADESLRPSDRFALTLAQRMPRAMRAVARMTRPT